MNGVKPLIWAFAFLFLFAQLCAVEGLSFDEEKSQIIRADCGTNASCCNNYNDLPGYFWNWLLLPLAIGEVHKELELLTGRLNEIDGLVRFRIRERKHRLTRMEKIKQRTNTCKRGER